MPNDSQLTSSDAALEVVPARMVNEVLYCERLAYLEWVQGEFADNHFTYEGRELVHRRVDRARPGLMASSSAPWRARSVQLTSDRLGLTAKIDLVEETADGRVVPVEYKRGAPAAIAERVWLPERAQLCCQALLLREHGHRCDEGWVWFAKSRERVVVPIDDALVATTMAAIERLRSLRRAGTLPPPLEDSPKCKGCSLSALCLPDEVRLLRGDDVGAPRRLQPPNDPRSPLYVSESGAKIGVRKELLLVTGRDGNVTEVRLPNTSQVCIHGHVQVSTQALRALLSRNVPVFFFTTGGWYLGRTTSSDATNVELRIAQYRATLDAACRTRIARTVIEDKIRNARTLLRRNGSGLDVELGELRRLAREAARTIEIESLLGIEGAAARMYFRSLAGLVRVSGADRTTGFDFERRNRRPPRDPVNAALSFSYALLAKECAWALDAVGLDPLLGFLHAPRHGRPSLALDIMEPFRPLIADSVVLTAFNTGELSAGSFNRAPDACALTDVGRKSLLAAYERRMSQEVTHPTFGYRISYRRLLLVQARLLSRFILREIPDPPSFRTR